MKRKLFVMLTIILVGTSLFTIAQTKVNINVKGFTGVENSISANVNISQSSEYVVEVIAPQSIIDDLNIYVEEGILKLKKKDSSFRWPNSDNKIIVNIWSPSYNSLILNGSGNIEAKTPIVSKDFVVKINGSGNVKVGVLEAVSLVIKSNGSGDVFVAGSKVLESVDYSINGSGDIDAFQLSSKKASAQINGSGDVKVWATVEFNARVTGSGNIDLKGNPTIDAKVQGSGRLKRG